MAAKIGFQCEAQSTASRSASGNACIVWTWMRLHLSLSLKTPPAYSVCCAAALFVDTAIVLWCWEVHVCMYGLYDVLYGNSACMHVWAVCAPSHCCAYAGLQSCSTAQLLNCPCAIHLMCWRAVLTSKKRDPWHHHNSLTCMGCACSSMAASFMTVLR